MSAAFTMTEQPAPSLFVRLHDALGRYWLPCGLFVMLTGLFWLPERHNYKVALNTLLILPCLLVLIQIQLWRKIHPHRWLLGSLLLYLGYFVIAALALQQASAIAHLKAGAMVLVFVLGAGLGMTLGQQRLQLLLQISIWPVVGALLYAFWRDWELFQGLGERYRMTGYGALYNPLRSGHLFGFFTIVAAWSAVQLRHCRVRQALFLLAGLICFAAVVLSGSRSPLLALACVALLMTLLIAPAHWRGRLLLGLIAAAGLLWLGFSDSLLARGLSYRPEVWLESLQLSAPRLYLGAGLGSELQINSVAGLVLSDPHNVFLAALYHGGLIGLALFVLLFGSALVLQYRHRMASPLIPLALALQLFGLLTLQFDGGSLIGRPTEFWHLYWVPMVLYLQGYRAIGP